MRLLYAIAALPLWLVDSQDVVDKSVNDKRSMSSLDDDTKLTFGLNLDFCAPDDDSVIGQIEAKKKKFWAWKLGLFGCDVYASCSNSGSGGVSIQPAASTETSTSYYTETINPAYTVNWVTEPGDVVTAYYTPKPVVTNTMQVGTSTITQLSTSTGTPIPYSTAYTVETES